MGRHQLVSHRAAGTTTANAHCEGGSGRALGQGQSLAMAPDPLVLSQAIGDQTSCSQPWATDARGGSGCLADSRAEDASRPVPQAARVFSPTAATPVYPEEKRHTQTTFYSHHG